MNKESLSFSDEAKSIVIGGLYQHYKGAHYKVLHLARDSETLAELVVYLPLYGEGLITVRSVAMFLENVSIDGKNMPRFKWVG